MKIIMLNDKEIISILFELMEKGYLCILTDPLHPIYIICEKCNTKLYNFIDSIKIEKEELLCKCINCYQENIYIDLST